MINKIEKDLVLWEALDTISNACICKKHKGIYCPLYANGHCLNCCDEDNNDYPSYYSLEESDYDNVIAYKKCYINFAKQVETGKAGVTLEEVLREVQQYYPTAYIDEEEGEEWIQFPINIHSYVEKLYYCKEDGCWDLENLGHHWDYNLILKLVAMYAEMERG